MRIWICIYIYKELCYIYIYICIHLHIYIYTYIYTHVYSTVKQVGIEHIRKKKHLLNGSWPRPFNPRLPVSLMLLGTPSLPIWVVPTRAPHLGDWSSFTNSVLNILIFSSNHDLVPKSLLPQNSFGLFFYLTHTCYTSRFYIVEHLLLFYWIKMV